MLLVMALVTGGISHRFKMLKREQLRLKSIVAQPTQELSEQLTMVDAKNRQILDSIVYARFLQNALSPVENRIIQNIRRRTLNMSPQGCCEWRLLWGSKLERPYPRSRS